MRGDQVLSGYTYFNWAGSFDDPRSTFGYVFFLGTSPITWSCKKYYAIALTQLSQSIE